MLRNNQDTQSLWPWRRLAPQPLESVSRSLLGLYSFSKSRSLRLLTSCLLGLNRQYWSGFCVFSGTAVSQVFSCQFFLPTVKQRTQGRTMSNSQMSGMTCFQHESK